MDSLEEFGELWALKSVLSILLNFTGIDDFLVVWKYIWH